MIYHYHVAYFAGNTTTELKETMVDLKFQIRTAAEVEMLRNKIRETEKLSRIAIAGISLLRCENPKKKPSRKGYQMPAKILNGK